MALWLERRTLVQEDRGPSPLAAILKPIGSLVASRCLSSLSCRNEYLAKDINE